MPGFGRSFADEVGVRATESLVPGRDYSPSSARSRFRSLQVLFAPGSRLKTMPIPDSKLRAVDSRYKVVRSTTRSLVESLSAEDQMVQSCPEASPVKWHQAHTTWFFETFVLQPFLTDYRPFREEFRRLFRSDYNSLGEDIPGKKSPACFSRPSLDEVLAFRTHVDRAMERLLVRAANAEALRRIVLGLNHEQQHQELILTDIKHAFFSNPLRPAYESAPLSPEQDHPILRLAWHSFNGGLNEVGRPANVNDPMEFCFDNETPRHRVFLEPFQIANREVTCREYLEFMADDGYTRPELWLPNGWETVKHAGWEAPLYWERDPADDTGWQVFTLRGWHGLSVGLDTSVCHISFFEADAYARWRGCRLPTEEEWEFAATQKPAAGNLLDSGRLHPGTATGDDINRIFGDQLFGDCWEWTASSYKAYPGYRPVPGDLSESNGKFLCGHIILRGGSCVTPANHIRATYRNFFAPATRWQFSGLRLAT